jgi:predicted transcriptional regulator of viral defense system
MPGLSTRTSRFLSTHPVFRLEEFRAECGGGRSEDTVSNRLRQFVASGRLRLLFLGVYAVTPLGQNAETFVPDPLLVASRLTGDSLLAYHSAFEMLGYARQTFTQTTYLTTGPQRPRHLDQHTFVAVSPPRRLGGEWDRVAVETVERQGLAVRTTCRERALVDCLDRRRYSGGFEELLACVGALPSLDFELLERYLVALGHPPLFARVGFVLERFADRLFFDDYWRERFSQRLPASPVYLLRREPGNVLVRRWRLLVPESLDAEEGSVLQ